MATTTKLSGASAAAVLPVEEYERAKEFWTDKVGMSVVDQPGQDGVGMLQAGNGTQVLLYQRERTKAEHTVLGFEVDDIEAVVADLKDHGVVFEEYDMPGITTENGIAWMGDVGAAWFTDTEGNIVSINQM
jgi:catechol 2,3-dioxygenase-like lactoylglutathione lyase family enzyme